MIIFSSLRFPMGRSIATCPQDTPGDLCSQNHRTRIPSPSPRLWTITFVVASRPWRPPLFRPRRMRSRRSPCSARPSAIRAARRRPSPAALDSRAVAFLAGNRSKAPRFTRPFAFAICKQILFLDSANDLLYKNIPIP